MRAYLVYRLLADGIVLVHFAFVVFVVGGGFLALRWRRLTAWHLAAAAWGALVEIAGWICPLTPLEIWLRNQAGESVYARDFVARHVLPILYPEGLTRRAQIVLGILVIAINLGVYGWAWRRRRARNR